MQYIPRMRWSIFWRIIISIIIYTRFVSIRTNFKIIYPILDIEIDKWEARVVIKLVVVLD